jgi:LysM repeat protein
MKPRQNPIPQPTDWDEKWYLLSVQYKKRDDDRRSLRTAKTGLLFAILLATSLTLTAQTAWPPNRRHYSVQQAQPLINQPRQLQRSYRPSQVQIQQPKQGAYYPSGLNTANGSQAVAKPQQVYTAPGTLIPRRGYSPNSATTNNFSTPRVRSRHSAASVRKSNGSASPSAVAIVPSQGYPRNSNRASNPSTVSKGGAASNSYSTSGAAGSNKARLSSSFAPAVTTPTTPSKPGAMSTYQYVDKSGKLAIVQASSPSDALSKVAGLADPHSGVVAISPPNSPSSVPATSGNLNSPPQAIVSSVAATPANTAATNPPVKSNSSVNNTAITNIPTTRQTTNSASSSTSNPFATNSSGAPLSNQPAQAPSGGLSTYQYVNKSGGLATIQASSPDDALSKIVGLADPHSGVMLVSGPSNNSNNLPAPTNAQPVAKSASPSVPVLSSNTSSNSPPTIGQPLSSNTGPTSTYQYVNKSGNVATVQATSPSDALSKVAGLADPHSGVIAISNPNNPTGYATAPSSVQPASQSNLLAPPPQPIASRQNTYTVKNGDTLANIAGAHNTTAMQLAMLNPQISNPNLIHPGDVLNLPTSGNSYISPNTSPANLTSSPLSRGTNINSAVQATTGVPELQNTFTDNLVTNTAKQLGEWGVEGTVIRAGGQVAAHTQIDPTSIGRAAAGVNAAIGVVGMAKSVVIDPWANAYTDTYQHPERSLTEDMSRYFTDLSTASASQVLKLLPNAWIGAGLGIVGDSARQTYRLQIQNGVLNIGDQIYGLFH